VALISILGANIRPDDSANANDQQLALARLTPGTTVQYVETPKFLKSNPKNGFTDGLFFGGKEQTTNRTYFDSLVVRGEKSVLYLNGVEGKSFPTSLLNAIAGKEIAEKQSALGSKRTFFLGTDGFGRDLLSRLMAGTIVSLSVGLISVLISLIIGISLGALAGYYGGKIDDLIMWLINVIWSIPTLLMVIAITLVMGKGFIQVFIAVGLTMWVEVARVVRGQVMGMKQRDFVSAGRALGYSDLRLIFKHILPNVMGPVIVISAANFASAILIEAGLSFLGIGTQIPMSSWGMMIKNHYPYITTDLAYLAILPGLCIIILVMAFMLLGNGIRDAMDVRAVN